MKTADDAMKLHEQGFNCAQSVVANYAEELGLEPMQATRISECFGGGICGNERLCGAVSGALMCAGLQFGRTVGGDTASRQKARDVGNEILQAFLQKHGTCECHVMLDREAGTRLGPDPTRSHAPFAAHCEGVIRDACALVEKLVLAR